MSRFTLSVLFVLLQLLSKSGLSQYAPQVGSIGCTAIHADSSILHFWATDVLKSQLGYKDISDTSLGLAAVGTADFTIGKADHMTFSLGDSGSIELGFDHEIYNGPGPDFVVFENGFSFGGDSTFLELAFVEVADSSGIFVRFPANSLTDTSFQVSAFGSVNASKINNLAGKYIGNYGTPFDLEDLKNIPNLNLGHIQKIKIIDVVGSLQQNFASKDANGRKINDPWPTPFASGGFDLDAVGIINYVVKTNVKELNPNQFSVYPNPTNVNGEIRVQGKLPLIGYRVFDVFGNEIGGADFISAENIFKIIAPNKAGIYFIQIVAAGESSLQKFVVQSLN